MLYYKGVTSSSICPPNFPNLERRTEENHGDVCRNEKRDGFKVGWICPAGCVFTNGRPWCLTSASGNSPCRVTSKLLYF